jgi:hypothetical protein
MATDSFVQVDTDGLGKKIDAEDVTIGANEVQRQRVVLVPGTLPQGCSIYHVVSAATTNAANIKAAPGQVYGWRIFNLSPSYYPIYVKLHNTAGTPTAGSGVVETIGVQAGVSDAFFLPTGSAFATGIGISIVKGIADNDATAVAANDCVVDIFYK